MAGANPFQKIILSLREKSISLFGGNKNRQTSPHDFTQKVSHILQKSLPEQDVILKGDLELEIEKIGDDKNVLVCRLVNLYNDCQRFPAQEDESINKYVATILEAINEYNKKKRREGLDPQCIVPVIKKREWVESLSQSQPDFSPAYDHLNDDLIVLYAIDTQNNISYHSSDEFDKIGLVGQRLREVAVANLRRAIPELRVEKININEDIDPSDLNIYKINADGYYETSLLLLDELWSEGALRVNGDIVVAIPARGELFATGSEDVIGLSMLTQLAKSISEVKNYPLLDTLLVYRNGEFQSFAYS